MKRLLSAVSSIALITIATAVSLQAATAFYVDPDYTGGGNDGSAAHPWAVLSSGSWTTINSSLDAGDVTVYFSALKADGATQQVQAWFLHSQRTSAASNRLALDGHSYYNSNTSTPNWIANPTPIATAYKSGKVFRLTSNGSLALGWTRADAASVVSVGGVTYTCIRTHVASTATQPGSVSNWHLYWDAHGSGGGTWSSGTTYSTRTRQDNVTLHGFDCQGPNSRVGFCGDNLVVEYLWAHDSTNQGAAVTYLYTSYPDGSAAQIITAPTTNVFIGPGIRVENTQGEGLYIGAINPDAPEKMQCDHGNQLDQVTITNFYIANTGLGGGQGDGIDSKNGITNYKITHGEIYNLNNAMGGIICPQTFADANQNMLIEDVWIHGMTTGTGNRMAIYGYSSTVKCSFKGYNGVTVRNCIVDTTSYGIGFHSQGGNCKNIHLYNNLVANVGGPGFDLTGADGGFEVRNNILLNNNGGGNQVSYSSISTSDHNAYNSTFGGTCTSCQSGASSGDLVNLSGGDFHLNSSSVVECKNGTTVSSFNLDYYDLNRLQSAAWDIGPAGYPGGTSTTDTTPPTVSLTAPANNVAVSGSSVIVSASASDDVGVVGVQFQLDGANLGLEDTSFPYSVNWDTTLAADGSHTLTAVARDAAGKTTTSAVVTVQVSNGGSVTDTTAPTVALTAPTKIAKVSGSSVIVSAGASDDVGVVGVQFQFDGANLGPEDTSAPYSVTWDTLQVANGAHTLTAVARDAAGNKTTSAAVNVRVSNSTRTSLAADTMTSTTTSPSNVVWVDDALPEGAQSAADGGDAWTWVTSNPAPFSATQAHQSALVAGLHEHYFYWATATMTVNTGDVLFAYIYLDPTNPPGEVMLQWYDGDWQHRAYWGANKLDNIDYGTDGTTSRYYAGALPAAGQWVRLEVPAGAVALEGSTLNGMAFTLDGGRATWDAAGKSSASQ